MAHTPGPWSEGVVVFDTSDGYGLIVYAPRDVVVAHGYGTERAEAAANARLIAAAPEMYAALRELEDSVRAVIDCMGPDGYLPTCGKPKTDELRFAHVQARAALAKVDA